MRTGQRIALLGILVSAVLAALKIVAGLMAHSNAVFADGLESAGDVLASGLVLLGLTLAAKPADSNHPYGHGRAEILTGLMIGFILFAAGLAIAANALLGAPDAKHPPASFAIWPLILSISVKGWLVAIKSRYGRKIGSAALLADAWNDSVDMLSGAVALVAVGLTLFDPERFTRADHFGAFCVGLIVIFTGMRVAHDTGLQLMDTMPDEILLNKIREAAAQVPGVEGVEKCYARKTGLQYHVDLHLEVDPNITVRESHEIASQVRDRVRENLNWVADVLVHVEPSPRPEYASRQRMNGI